METFIKWFVFFLILFAIIAIIKKEVTIKNHCKVCRAIQGYRAVCRSTNRKPVVSSEDMVEFEKSAKRIFDWGCKNILPKDKFELIKPFLED